ncbi:MAG TPA: alpha/beta hydrolase [Methylomirabilota bacterium]|nr:alpha/beta hydrolase [Methylomirabilota bacterium]
MATFFSDGLEIAYFDEGQGRPILLIHGFASNKMVNWAYPSWVDTLTRAGRRVIAIDNRGHGESAKLYDPEDYRMSLMAGDACRLLDHLELERADVMGYSMGARIGALLTLTHPERVRSLVLGGLGYGLVAGMIDAEPIAAALEAQTLAEVSDPTGRAFRQFAEQTKGDLRALAACMRAFRRQFTEEEVGRIVVPTLIAVGTRDLIAGSPADLAALMPNAEVLEITGRDHMVAVGDRVFKQGVVRFLSERDGPGRS